MQKKKPVIEASVEVLMIKIIEDISARRLETKVNDFCLKSRVKDMKLDREPGKYIALIQYYK